MKKIFMLSKAGLLLSCLFAQVSAADLTCTLTAASLDLLFGTSGTLLIPNLTDGYIYAALYDAVNDNVVGVGYLNDASSAMLVSISTDTGSPAFGVSLGLGNISLYALAQVTTGTLVAGGDTNFTLISLSPDGIIYSTAPAAFGGGARINALLPLSGNRIMAAGSNPSYMATAIYPNDLSSVTSSTFTVIGDGGEITALTLAEDGTIIATGDGYAGNDYFVPFIKYDTNGNVLTSTFYAVSTFFADTDYCALYSIAPFDANNVLATGIVNTGAGYAPLVVKVSNDLQTVQTITVIDQLSLGSAGSSPIKMQKDSEGYFVLQSYLSTGETAFTRLTPTGGFDYTFAQNCIATQTIAATFGLVIDYTPYSFAIEPTGHIFSLGSNAFQQSREPAVIKLFAPLGPPVPPTPTGCTSSDPLTCAIQRKYFSM